MRCVVGWQNGNCAIRTKLIFQHRHWSIKWAKSVCVCVCLVEECSLEKYSGNYNSLANGNHRQNKGQNRILQCNWRSDVELAAEFACSYVICSLAKNHQKETRNLSQLVGEERMLPRREECGGTPKTGSTLLNLIMCKKNAYHFFICFVFATKLSWF